MREAEAVPRIMGMDFNSSSQPHGDRHGRPVARDQAIIILSLLKAREAGPGGWAGLPRDDTV